MRFLHLYLKFVYTYYYINSMMFIVRDLRNPLHRLLSILVTFEIPILKLRLDKRNHINFENVRKTLFSLKELQIQK